MIGKDLKDSWTCDRLNLIGQPAEHFNQTINMNIRLWYNKDVSQWRWTLTDDSDPMSLESGNSTELRGAMDDIASTVEWMVEAPH
jgi:hypothetical protein